MNVANYQLDELLEKVNSSENVELALKDLITNKPYAKMYMDYATNDKFITVDIDEIQYKFSEYHRSMSGAFLCSRSTAKIYEEILIPEHILNKTKRYQLKSLLEMLYAGEAKILEAVIKKNLTDLYPNITHEMMCKVL